MGLFGEILGGVGSMVGFAVGTVVGVSAAVIAAALGITTAMVDEATRAGCRTYEEIRNFHDL